MDPKQLEKEFHTNNKEKHVGVGVAIACGFGSSEDVTSSYQPMSGTPRNGEKENWYHV